MSSNTPDQPGTDEPTDKPTDEPTEKATHDMSTERTEVLTGHHAPSGTEPTRPLSATPARPAERPTQTQLSPAPPVAPEVVRGPYVAPVILGLVCLAVAALAFAQEIADWSIDWGNVGPLGIVVAGAVLVVLGLVGLLSSRRRRS